MLTLALMIRRLFIKIDGPNLPPISLTFGGMPKMPDFNRLS